MKRLRNMTEPELTEYFNGLATMIQDRLPDGDHLFCLLVFEDPKICQYVSNARRDDMIKALRETADRLETRTTIEREQIKEN